MRISTSYPQQFNINSMFDQQSKLNETQLKISSGKQYLTPGENPSAAAYSLGFKQSIGEATQYQDNIAAANQRLSLEDTTLASVTDTIQRLQELGLQGVSDSGNSVVGRNAIADEFDQLNQQLLSLANTRNSNGEYLFSGTKTNVMPFSKQSAIDAQSTTTPFIVNSTTDETAPAEAWTKYVSKEAIRDANNYIVNVNPNGTLADALAWATDHVSTYSALGQSAAASKTTTSTPASWQTAWDNTGTVFMAEFEKAFTEAGKKGATPGSVAHAAVAPLADSSVASSAAYDAYTRTLASYIPPIVDTTTATAAVTTDTTTATTTTNPSVYVYSGSNAQRSIQIGSARTITDGDTGIAVFADTTTGQTIFDAVKNFSAELRADKPTLETLQKLDNALTQISTIRSNVGARQNAIERQRLTNQDFIINTQTALSQVEDLDYATAITNLNAQQLSLQAAQQSYAKVQSMTLFKFI